MVLPQAGVNLVAETDEYEKGIRKAVRESDKADRAFTDLINAANRLDRALDIDGKVKVKVDKGELDEVEDRLESLQKLQVIEISLQVAEFALPVIGGIIGAVTGPIQDLIEIDRVLGQVEARTGGMLPNARELISELWVNGWGESREELGQVITKLFQLGIEQDKIGASATAVLATSQIMGADIGEILRTTSSLITNDLAPNIEAATDLIIRGLQETGDPADDLLDTLNEYSSTFKGLGIDGQLAISILDSALEDAFFDTDKAADALREFRIRISEIDNNDTNQTLDKLGLLDERLEFMADPGQFGPTFLSDVIQNIGAIEDPAQRAFATTALFGTQLEDLGPTALAALDPLNLFNGLIKDIPGATTTASAAINNNLGQSILELKRTVSEELLVALDETFDISGKIDTAKEKVQEFATIIRSGVGFGEALEIVFGLETGAIQSTLDKVGNFLERLENAFADFIIDFLNALSFLDPRLGAIAADLALTRVPFELARADTVEETTAAFTRAGRRGVSPDVLKPLLEQEINKLIFGDGGGLTGEGILDAQQLIDALITQPLSGLEPGHFTNARKGLQEVASTLLGEFATALDNQDIGTALDLVSFVSQMFPEQEAEKLFKTEIVDPFFEEFNAAILAGDASGVMGLADTASLLAPFAGLGEDFDPVGFARSLLFGENEPETVLSDIDNAQLKMQGFFNDATIDVIDFSDNVETEVIRMGDNWDDATIDITDLAVDVGIQSKKIIDWLQRITLESGLAQDALAVMGVHVPGSSTTTTTTTDNSTSNSNNTTNINIENPPAPVDPIAEGVDGAPTG